MLRRLREWGPHVPGSKVEAVEEDSVLRSFIEQFKSEVERICDNSYVESFGVLAQFQIARWRDIIEFFGSRLPKLRQAILEARMDLDKNVENSWDALSNLEILISLLDVQLSMYEDATNAEKPNCIQEKVKDSEIIKKMIVEIDQARREMAAIRPVPFDEEVDIGLNEVVNVPRGIASVIKGAISVNEMRFKPGIDFLMEFYEIGKYVDSGVEEWSYKAFADSLTNQVGPDFIDMLIKEEWKRTVPQEADIELYRRADVIFRNLQRRIEAIFALDEDI